MRVLLDTCTFLWFLAERRRLPASLIKVLRDPANEVFLSVVSVWEASVKQQLGSLPLPGRAAEYLPEQRERHGIDTLSLDEASIRHLNKLPNIHRDPFDRMLVCQALEHELVIATSDDAILAYPCRAIWK